MENIKELLFEAHRWELLVILDFMINDSFFEFLKGGKTREEIMVHSRYSNRVLPTFEFFKKIKLIEERENKLYNSAFAETYFTRRCNKFIGNYISWKVKDVQNWKDNIGKVLKGEIETAYVGAPLEEGREENGAPLQEIISVCGFLYPSKEFSDLISKYKLMGTLMDLGCGTGEWSFLIGQKFKDLKLIEVDYNPQNSEKRLREVYPSLAPRTQFIKDDFLTGELPESNIALVSQNFMEYSDAQITSLIKKLRENSKTKTMLIHEYILDGDEYSFQYDVYCALVTKQGRLRNKEEWEYLLKDFKTIRFEKMDFGSYAIIATDEDLGGIDAIRYN